MGRSVSTHRHAVATVYLSPEFEDGDDEGDAFRDFLDDLRDNVLPTVFPSLSECDRWQDREDHVIMENGRCEVSVSEYCGLVAICLAPLDPYNGLDKAWCERAANNFTRKINKMFGKQALHSVGRASNGEQFFQVAGEPGSCVTSKEGRLW